MQIGKAVSYRSAGTVEFVYDDAAGEFFFLEVNTRLQVEHGVTEEVTGIDLVAWMVRQASGDLPPLSTLLDSAAGPFVRGPAVRRRCRAGLPAQHRAFDPCSSFPPGVRVETWVEPGTEITPYYDPMVAKLIVRGADRPQALAALQAALAATQLGGHRNQLRLSAQESARRRNSTAGAVTTSFLSRFPYQRTAIEVLSGGTQTTVQDYPGRLGFWNVGVPPSGPMDSLALRLANRLVGNDDGAAGSGNRRVRPGAALRLRRRHCSCGAPDGGDAGRLPRAVRQAVKAGAGATLKIGIAKGPGLRAYLAVGGGLEVGEYLGSRSTFMLGGFGGHDGRALRPGDVIHLQAPGAGLDTSRNASCRPT